MTSLCFTVPASVVVDPGNRASGPPAEGSHYAATFASGVTCLPLSVSIDSILRARPQIEFVIAKLIAPPCTSCLEDHQQDPVLDYGSFDLSSSEKFTHEIVVRILGSLNVKELLACRSTSRRLRDIISNSMVLQYHIRLAASGMRDGPSSEVSTRERMAALEKYNEAWRELAWSSYDTIDIPASGMPQISDGFVVSFSDDRKSLTVRQLPSKLRRLGGRTWTLEFGFIIVGFAIDASQDLLVLVPISDTRGPSQWCEPRILIRALSDGQSHPLAMPSGSSSGSDSKGSAIELQDSDGDRGNIQPSMECDTTRIHGDYLGTIVHGGPMNFLSIWNWKTGRQEWSMPIDKGISQWCFLDDSRIVFPKNVTYARYNRHRRLHVCRFRGASDTGADDERIFALPDQRHPCRSSMGARLLSEPKTAPDDTASWNENLLYNSKSTLFYPSDEDDLLTVELWAYDNGSGWEVSDLHVPARVLRSPPPLEGEGEGEGEGVFKRDDGEPDASAIVPWKVWGRGITQSHPLDHPRDMSPLGPLSHGLRRIAWDCGMKSRYRGVRGSRARAEAAKLKTVSVYDLHPGRVGLAIRHGGAQSQAQSRSQHVLSSEVLLPQEIQDADSVGLKFAMCGDALVVLELCEYETNRLHLLTF
ncbi:hypothetical protein B0F90DRAFT_1927449 [Multifurca ochricompacta]|uniref:F-box domain-containing protein n=1 Tax=Multifurca ochricompacta TaxID=376703 RepID=A0AAD4M0K8_9AGAM|nr:hypothetical protein B0F90DRAFT_1927449 [Multifurca ochricompacta]